MVSTFAAAQEVSNAMKKGAIQIEVFGGGGTGVGASSDTQMMNAGVRLGKVLTGSHGSGFLRGNLEYAIDVVPLNLFFQDHLNTATGRLDRETVYAGSISALVLKWNFTGGKRIAPWIALEESAIFTADNVPAGDTASTNFSSGFGAGLQFFRSNGHALNFSGHMMHISNASIGNHNPGLNVAMQFRLGYQWWK
jgi:hypothetical protein